MLKNMMLLAAATVIAGAAFAAPGDKDKSKVVEIKTCPMTSEAVKGPDGGKSLVKVGKTTYQVDFCCAGCKPQFDKMTQKEKETKIAELTKKSAKKKG